jgi:hypothetical protein
MGCTEQRNGSARFHFFPQNGMENPLNELFIFLQDGTFPACIWYSFLTLLYLTST